MAGEVDLVIIGNVAYDETHVVGGETRISNGGGAFNAALAATTVDAVNVGIVARAGEDYDPQTLLNRGVDTTGLAVVGRRTARFIFTEDPATNTRQIECKYGVLHLPVNTNIFPSEFANARHIHLATDNVAAQNKWIDFLLHNFPNTRISVDAFEHAIRRDAKGAAAIADKATLVFLNTEELALLQKAIPQFGLERESVLKMGRDGASYRNTQTGDTYSVAAPHVVVRDTTGAGDTLAGRFLAGLLAGEPFQTALESAVNLASQSVTGFGVEHLYQTTSNQ